MTTALWFRRPRAWVELFATANLAFLAADIFVAHSYNSFAHSAEWVPLVFSLSAPLILVIAMVAMRSPEPLPDGVARWFGLAVGWVSVAIGVAGLVFHLRDTFFLEQTIKNLVYTAPFVAPLSYTGIGLLFILDRMVKPPQEWAHWVVFLALGGFIGNFILCLTDHAQNGFFDRREWIGVATSAFAVGFLLALQVDQSSRFLHLCRGVLLLQIGVGLLGSYYHLAGLLGGGTGSLWEGIVYGAPVFAPLLFPNLALLALIGLWGLESCRVRELVDVEDRLSS